MKQHYSEICKKQNYDKTCEKRQPKACNFDKRWKFHRRKECALRHDNLVKYDEKQDEVTGNLKADVKKLIKDIERLKEENASKVKLLKTHSDNLEKKMSEQTVLNKSLMTQNENMENEIIKKVNNTVEEQN